jgi:guanine deaminase
MTEPSDSSTTFGVRGLLLDYTGDPELDPSATRFESDGLLVVSQGRVVGRGSYSTLRPQFPDIPVRDTGGKLVCPGFVDAHVHFPQMDVIASYGHQLLDWLTTHTFPAEMAFGDLEFAERRARDFVQQLLRHGTTTALVLCSVHPESVTALASVAAARDLRMILGKVLMDRNAPASLLDTPERSYEESTRLIQRWHGLGRIRYAVTPRFAGTSSREQLNVAGVLRRETPSVYVHTHLAENLAEVAWMRELFPERRHYTDIYEHYGLLGERTVLAHGIHLQEDEVRLLAETRSVIAFCPTSNLFLGSGLFPYVAVKQAGVRIALASDVGAGTSLSQLRTLGEAYKVTQLSHTRPLSPHEGWYLATLGSARALSLEGLVGNFELGCEADFVVLDWDQVPLLGERVSAAKGIDDVLFALMVLGDDRCVAQTYVRGVLAYTRTP